MVSLLSESDMYIHVFVFCRFLIHPNFEPFSLPSRKCLLLLLYSKSIILYKFFIDLIQLWFFPVSIDDLTASYTGKYILHRAATLITDWFQILNIHFFPYLQCDLNRFYWISPTITIICRGFSTLTLRIQESNLTLMMQCSLFFGC